MSKNRPHARRAARSRAFQVLYSLQFSPSTTLGDVRTAFLEMPDPTDADMDENAETREEKLYGFAWELVEGVWSNVKNLDSVIERFSQNWRVDRLGKIELTLLRLAVFEMLYRLTSRPRSPSTRRLNCPPVSATPRPRASSTASSTRRSRLRKPVRSQLRARPTPDRLAGFDAKAGRSRSGPRLYSNKDQS